MALADILTLISITGILGGFLWSVFKTLKKLIEFIDSVNSVVSHVNKLDEASGAVHQSFDTRLNEHDKHLVKHDEELKTLFNWKDKGN